jgi:hypothetical protein
MIDEAIELVKRRLVLVTDVGAWAIGLEIVEQSPGT